MDFNIMIRMSEKTRNILGLLERCYMRKLQNPHCHKAIENVGYFFPLVILISLSILMVDGGGLGRQSMRSLAHLVRVTKSSE